jgi:hypothetical protein
MRFGTRNVRSLHSSGSLKTVASELAKYNVDLVAVHEVRSIEGGSQPADDYKFFYGNGNANYHIEASSFVYKEVVSALRREEFIVRIALHNTKK